jgi:uncharacterized membrane protein YedE/YeeE
MKALVSLLCGTVFGFGLQLSGMANPAKVAGFLDVLGAWDPSLAFVMGGALVVTVPAFFLTRRGTPLLEPRFHFPDRTAIDGRLVGGAALFGVGWGVSGLCPGPAIANLGRGVPEILAFVAAMAAGMMLHDRFLAGLLERKSAAPAAPPRDSAAPSR